MKTLKGAFLNFENFLNKVNINEKNILYFCIIIALVVGYFVVNFFFFDSWACHSSKKQLNEYLQHHDSRNLKRISKDNPTYQFLKSVKNVSIDREADNQGSGDIGYYRININGKLAYLLVKIKDYSIITKTEIKTIQLKS